MLYIFSSCELYKKCFSVANTAKRAILIWLSVLIFANEVTILSAVGTVAVMLGVLLYHRARDFEERRTLLTKIERGKDKNGPKKVAIV